MPPSLRRLARGALLRMVHRIAPTEAETALRFLESRSFDAFPKRNVTVASQVPAGRVLVLSPHPDDEAIGMGGTLAMHAAGGSEVTVVYLTDGGGLDEPRDELIRTRRAQYGRGGLGRFCAANPVRMAHPANTDGGHGAPCETQKVGTAHPTKYKWRSRRSLWRD